MAVTYKQACRAMEKGEFIPYFQPLVTLRTGQLAGFEVLARWQHPTRGIILPGHFIAAAEKNGWIGDLMQALLKSAFAAATSIPEPLSLSINVSPVQLKDLDLPSQIQAVSGQSGFPLRRLIVEVTESALTFNLENARIIANELKQMGCRIALDDFGTGYSSLLHLQSLPFDDLKVDRSFVNSMTDQRDSRKIVAAVIGLGQSLGLTTVAEGVETKEQAEMLLWMGCELGQGWLFGKPLPAADLPSVVSANRQRLSTGISSKLINVAASNVDTVPAQRLAQLQAVYDGSPVGLAFLDRNSRYVNLNQRLADMNGSPVADHLGRTVAEMLPEFFPIVEPYIHRALQGEAFAGIELQRIDPMTKLDRTVLLSYQPAHDEANQVVGLSVSLIDITDRKLAEQALRESEDHYRHMVELNPQIPWIMNSQGKNIDVSPKWEARTGLTKEQTKGDQWLNALHPDDVQPTLDHFNICLRTGESIDWEYRVIRPEGGWGWMRTRGSPQFGEDGKIMRWYGSVEDIEDYKHIEQELRKTNAQLQAVINAVPVGIILADAQSDTLSLANPEALKILRQPLPTDPQIADVTPLITAISESKLIEAADAPLSRALLHGETTPPREVLSQHEDGTELWVTLAGAPVLGQNDEVVGGVVIIQDIDAAKQARKRLVDIADALITELQPEA